jgi:3-phosphoshikimate 1-carboxyvinyltransferase
VPEGLSARPRLVGVAGVPGDKSVAHRALLLASMADGPSTLVGVPNGDDVAATRDAVVALGARVAAGADRWTVEPAATWAADPTLDARNSGTTARLLAGALAARGAAATIVGDASLAQRPMERVARPLLALGARVSTTGGHLPLRVEPAPLLGATWHAEVPSAQVKSAFLLAALGADGDSGYVEATPTRDHLERMLPVFGVPVHRHEGAIRVSGRGARVRGASVVVPGDLSSAAFLLAGAALLPGSDVTVEGVGLNDTRLGFVRALDRMGAAVEVRVTRESQLGGEPTGRLRVRHAPLRGVRVRADAVPTLLDELPLLALCAAGAEGASRFEGAGELRHKESDRLQAVLDLLVGLGVRHGLEGDTLTVTGARELRPCGLDARGDHRIAMLLALVTLVTTGSVGNRDPCVAVSWPAFYDQLEALRVD